MTAVVGSVALTVHQSNVETRDMWAAMRRHRERVMREIRRSGRQGRLCVLGAGNCNDLDLPSLAASFEEVHLVDLDSESLALGVDRQGMRGNPRLSLHAPVDFAGATLELHGGATSLQEVAVSFSASVDALSSDAVPRRCDVVVSACVVSQLVKSAVERFGAETPGIHDLGTDMRNRHVDLVLERTAPGGAVVLVADMVSSDTVPDLLSCPDMRLGALRDQLVRERNFFHATNPYAIEQYLTKRHARSIGRLTRSPPWRWHIGSRAFLVNAVQIELSLQGE